MSNSEVIQFQNHLGMVTSKKVILKHKRAEESIPLDQITSISFRHQKGYFGIVASLIGSGIAIAGLVHLTNDLKGEMILLLVALLIVFVLIGVASWVGRHYLTLKTSNKTCAPLKVTMANTKEGQALYIAIDKAL